MRTTSSSFASGTRSRARSWCVAHPRAPPSADGAFTAQEVTDVGDPRVKELASDCDVRTDVPLYRIFRRGALEAEVTDISEHWTSDMVAFLLGCSFSFEAALAERGIPLRHVEEGRNVPMYRTSVACKPAGRFSGRLVVSMRPMTPGQAIEAVRITSAFPRVHGRCCGHVPHGSSRSQSPTAIRARSPVHFGDPSLIGISDIYKPDYGDAVTIKEGEVG